MLAAVVPLALATLADPVLLDERVVAALTLGTPGGTTLPIGALAGALATCIPVGDLPTRIAVLSAIPAALATWSVTRTAAAASFAGPRWGASLVVLALGIVVGVSLRTAPSDLAFVVLAVDLLLARGLRGLAALAVVVGAWAAPRHLGTLAAALFLAGGGPSAAALVGGAFVVAPLAAMAFVRPEGLGGAPTLPFAAEPLGPVDPAQARALGVVAVLAVVAWLGAKDASGRPRVLLALVAAAGLLLKAPGALVVAVAALAPLAAQAGSALTIAATEAARGERQTLRRFAAFGLVPALCLGLSARAFEVQLLGARVGAVAASTRDLHGLFGLGSAPPRAVWIVEDEPALVRVLRARLVDGLRPDVRILPVQGLLSTLAVRTTHAVMAEEPAIREVMRALLARGGLEPADLAPLAQRVALVADVAPARLRGIARHAQPLGTAIAFYLERVDPSDRRLRRAAAERRWAALALAKDDPLRDHLRASALREARLLSLARDTEGTIAALRRAEAFGEPAAHVRALLAKVQAKQALD